MLYAFLLSHPRPPQQQCLQQQHLPSGCAEWYDSMVRYDIYPPKIDKLRSLRLYFFVAFLEQARRVQQFWYINLIKTTNFEQDIN